jgi:transposase
MAHTQTGVRRTLFPKSGDKGNRWLIKNMACYPLGEKEECMTQERLTLRKIREILRLKHEAGMSNRAIAGACKISNSTVGEYLRRAKMAGISWPLLEISEEELYQKLFPEQKPALEKVRSIPDWEAVRKELRQKGVTLRLVWMEYLEEHPDGYQYSQYCEYYRRWNKLSTVPAGLPKPAQPGRDRHRMIPGLNRRRSLKNPSTNILSGDFIANYISTMNDNSNISQGL